MLILTLAFLAIVWISNKGFDKLWVRSNSIPVTNLDDVYGVPVKYDDYTKINIKLITKDKIVIEGNKKLRTLNENKDYGYYDTVSIKYPADTDNYVNKIYLNFYNTGKADSVFLVVAKSETTGLFWKQIFLSSVKVINLNEFSNDTAQFRIKEKNLAAPDILRNNDTLINSALNYFNSNKDNLKLLECGTNSLILDSIFKKFNLPSRTVGLQGGDGNFAGLSIDIGYPLHEVCEVYSTLYKKWYVIDPTYGFRYKEKNSDEFMNAVEISNKFFFLSEKDIVQDSVLFTKRNLLGSDYFKYYENIYYTKEGRYNYFLTKFIQHFYGKFNYKIFHYSNKVHSLKNGFYYIGFKSLLYLILFGVYFNFILFIMTKRLFLIKKPVKQNFNK